MKNIRLGTLNTRSIKSKEELIVENFNKYKLDALLITETWLQNTLEDNTWLQTSEFHKDGHEISNINRQDKRGGGIALQYSTKYKIKTVAHTKYSSFESGVWHIQSGSTHYMLLGVYHPPVGTLQGFTNSIFIDDLTELLMEVVSNNNNIIIILGDINIHLTGPEDADAKALCNTFEIFNITQHIKFPTHNLGHALDIIVTEIRQNRNITTIPGPYISNH